MPDVPDLVVGGQLKVGGGVCPPIGEGDHKINGSAGIEGPVVVGAPLSFPNAMGTLMAGPLKNPDPDVKPPFIPGMLVRGVHNPYSLAVNGNAAIFWNLDTAFQIQAGTDVIAQNDVICYAFLSKKPKQHNLSAKKDFDIPHPTKEGWRLTHACVEGPEAAVYTRGRVTNKKEILLPTYWKELVDWTTITVNLTPIGAHQNVIVKRFDEEKIYLQSNGGIPIDCFYHIYAERQDTERLIPEYEGTIEDYPGDNSQRSIVGYHYDKRGT